MKCLTNNEEVLCSWRRCMEKGLPSNLSLPEQRLENHELEIRKKKQFVVVCI